MPYKITLAGNPNCGKTSLFNAITGANQRVANYGGVTVDIKEGSTKFGDEKLSLVDLPGTYSLSAFSGEEEVACNYLIHEDVGSIVDVLDSTNLERNLYLTVQLIETGLPLVLAFNMKDEAYKKRIKINLPLMEKLLGVKIVPTNGRKGEGVDELVAAAIQAKKPDEGVQISYGFEIEKYLKKIAEKIEQSGFEKKGLSTRFYAVKLAENDRVVSKMYSMFMTPETEKLIFELHERVQRIYNDDIQTVMSEARYGFAHGAVKEAVTQESSDKVVFTEKIDRIVLHKFWAYPIFGLFMWALFQLTFTLGAIPLDWIDGFFGRLGDWVATSMADSWFKDLLVDGIIAGVGSVMVFLPNILILFLGMSFLEDTGYMARIAFLMDKLMHKMGLHGKSFIPLLMGTGCTVPAVMAARNLESEKDRILTILITPLVSCGARLPVYILFAGVFFPENAGNIVFLLYFLGFAIALFMGLLFRKTLFRKTPEHPFVMEMPPYRMPTFRSVLLHMWEKARHYLEKMGGVVLLFSIVLWLLASFPKTSIGEASSALDAEIAALTESYDAEMELLQTQSDVLSLSEIQAEIVLLESERDEAAQSLELTRDSLKTEASFIGKIGHGIEPIMRPAGFDWRMSVSLVTGFVAKEVVVSTMGVLFSTGEPDESEDVGESALGLALTKAYDRKMAFSYMLFVLLYTPCIVALATVIRELSSWKWSLFAAVYPTVLAWMVSTFFYRIASLF